MHSVSCIFNYMKLCLVENLRIAVIIVILLCSCNDSSSKNVLGSTVAKIMLTSFLQCLSISLLLYNAECAQTSISRALTSNYGTSNTSFNPPVDIAINILGYASMDTAVQFAICDSSCNNMHQQRQNQLFGSMNHLLLSKNQCLHCGKRSLRKKLHKIPTFKHIYVNISSLINRESNVLKILGIFQTNNYEFIRGIASSSNLPFLMFLLSTDVPCTQQEILRRFMIVIFNHDGIDSIIYSQNPYYSYSPWSFTHLNEDNIEDIERIISLNDLTYLLRYGKVYNVLNESNSVWIHQCDVARTEKKCFNIRVAVKMSSILAVIMICGIVGTKCIYLSTPGSASPIFLLGSLIGGFEGLLFTFAILMATCCPPRSYGNDAGGCLQVVISFFAFPLCGFYCWAHPAFNALCFAVFCVWLFCLVIAEQTENFRK